MRADPTTGNSAAARPSAEHTPAAVDPPAEFGRYRIEKLLGCGGMGRVYLARDTQLGRLVALKIPRSDSLVADSQVERFYREARSAATLAHPNICPIYDVGEIGGIHFISMGFVEGRALAECLQSEGVYAEREAAELVRTAAIALQEAHDRGVIHRDLKPANIVIDRRGAPVVMDFGLARPIAPGESGPLTTAEIVIGTPAYMSPEQVEGRRDLGPATDIYSLGVVLYELLAGRPPFRGTAAHIVGQVVHCEPPALEELRPGMSRELAAICRRAMAKAPEARFASMNELGESLAVFLEKAPQGDRPAERVALATPFDSAGMEAPTVRRPAAFGTAPLHRDPALQNRGVRSPVVWLAGGAAGIAALVAAIVLAQGMWKPPPPPPPERSQAETTPDPHSAGSPPRPGRKRPPPRGMQPYDEPSPGPSGAFEPGRPHRKPERRAFEHVPPPEDASFADLDQDGDERLTPHELMLHVIRRADADGDDALTPAEFEAGREQFGPEFFGPPGPGEHHPREFHPPPPDQPRPRHLDF
jgi:predicted Ser/Thr protein kinase